VQRDFVERRKRQRALGRRLEVCKGQHAIVEVHEQAARRRIDSGSLNAGGCAEYIFHSGAAARLIVKCARVPPNPAAY
jgi:hypothetical protein